MDQQEKYALKQLIRKYGLRPVVDAVGYAARQMFEAGETINDEDGEPMDPNDVRCAVDNITCGDLY